MSTTVTTIITGGTILLEIDADGRAVTTDAIAFADGRVAAVGTAAREWGADEAGSRPTERIDLAGGTLIPALGDGHAHPVLGGLESAGPRVREQQDLAGIIAAVAEWKREHPDAPWIVGASYDATFAPGGRFDAAWLDAVTGDTPTILRAWDYHTAWVNSAALAAGGITAATPDPPLGRIVRREDGSPLGTLQEAAANAFLADVVPSFALADRVAAIEQATREYAALGITWVQDAWVDPGTPGEPGSTSGTGDLATYRAAAAQDRLHTRVNLAFRADPARWREQVAEFSAHRDELRALGHERLSGETVKFFVDGVIENHTAALLAPYADRPDDRGLPNWTAAELQAATAAFDAAGFQLHLHAIGDGANRLALDALEAAIRQDPDPSRSSARPDTHALGDPATGTDTQGDPATGTDTDTATGTDTQGDPSTDTDTDTAATRAPARAHVIAHVAMLAPGDAKRFAELGVIANFEPYWAQCDAVMQQLTIPHIGHDREGWQYLIGSVLRGGATVSFGSDWPVTTKDWRPAFATAVTRRSHLEPDAASWLPEERVTPAAALAAYTRGIAAQAQAPDRGALLPGCVADAAWLSADPLSVDPDAVPRIEVLGTWLAGRRTHGS